MGEQEDLLVSVHDVVLDFLPDFDSLSNPPCCPIRFPADNCRLLSVDDVIFCVDMVCDRRFVLLRPTVSLCFWCISYLRVIPLPSGVPSHRLQIKQRHEQRRGLPALPFLRRHSTCLVSPIPKI